MTRLSSFGTQFEMLGPLEAQLLLGLTFLAFQSKNNLTGCLCLFVKHGFGLSTETHLFGIVTALSLCEVRCLTGLVLCHFVKDMLLALSLAVGFTFLWYIHHCIY